MRQASLAGWTSILAAAVSAVVMVLMLHRGTAAPDDGEAISLDASGWAILVTALACLAVSVVLSIYSRFLYHSVVEAGREARQTASDEPVEPQPAAAAEAPDLSRLPEDERRLYEIVEAAGGEILQMKLVSSGEFSKSKVTRLLDKLEDRELIKRERHGMTNMVKLVRRP